MPRAPAAARPAGGGWTLAGVVQRCRQPIRQAVRWVCLRRALRLAAARRAQRSRLPPASRRRSAVHFEVLALESIAVALQAAQAGDAGQAAAYAAEAHWFAEKAGQPVSAPR